MLTTPSDKLAFAIPVGSGLMSSTQVMMLSATILSSVSSMLGMMIPNS
ncbi:Uncharacterised protein [Vibrio cholerae]|nr:Uncharacterised protein [Vibrio cholerae]